jgi:UDP-N-acetylglucosamine transferase subunit ALG13
MDSIKNNPPDYDIYMTGSDQVWNSRFIGDDSAFFLGFVGAGKPKVSYAASISNRGIDIEYEEKYQQYLKDYKSISVRKASTAKIVSDLTGRDVNVVCDPSLLLDKDEWLKICPKKTLVDGDFLLLYVQSYSFDPYPNIVVFTQKMAERLGLKVVVLMGLKDGYAIDGATVFETAGPFEFLQLFRDARFVITTSFHGTAFALNFGKNFYSVVKKIDGEDCRIADFLRQCSAEHHLLEIDSLESVENLPEAGTAEKETLGLQQFRNQSLDFLRDTLRQ